MRRLRILLLLPFVIAFSCDDESKPLEPIEERLIETGLLGRWEIADESVNGISDLLPKFGRFFEFNLDDIPDDLQGRFLYEDETGVYPGVFTVNQANQTILFERENREPKTYNYTINDTQDYLSFTFIEDGSEWQQGWARRD